MDETSKRIGAGGYWKTIGEKPDFSVVKQLTPYSRVSAVGKILLRKSNASVKS